VNALGNLLTYAFVDDALLVLRLHKNEDSASKYSPVIFMGLSLLSAIAVGNGWNFEVQVIIWTLMIATLLLLIKLIPKIDSSDKYFRAPLVPLIPCLGIYLNFLLCTIGCGLDTWILFLMFEMIGVTFYFTYGFKNSKLQ